MLLASDERRIGAECPKSPNGYPSRPVQPIYTGLLVMITKVLLGIFHPLFLLQGLASSSTVRIRAPPSAFGSIFCYSVSHTCSFVVDDLNVACCDSNCSRYFVLRCCNCCLADFQVALVVLMLLGRLCWREGQVLRVTHLGYEMSITSEDS